MHMVFLYVILLFTEISRVTCKLSTRMMKYSPEGDRQIEHTKP
uniref:Uncharacterized protein n=1 Tax=Rhizophora mucronata TaxID=61149 RepID=A0A2P2PXM4_RHIMU